MWEVWKKVIFFRKNHGPYNFGLVIAILGFCLFIRPADMSTSTTSSSRTIRNNPLFDKDLVCYTKACNETAELMLRNMDSNVSPCNNFYKYACGNYQNTTEIPATEFVLDFFVSLKFTVISRLNQSLNGNTNNNKTAYKLVRNLYKSCMNTENREKNSKRNIISKINDIGGWPVVDGDTWNATGFDYLNAMYKLYQFGFSSNYLMSFDVIQNPRNITQRIIKLSRPQLFLDNFISKAKNPNSIRKEYLKLITNIAIEFGAEKNRAAYEMEQVMLFEEHLSYMGYDAYPADMNIEMMISELNEKYPNIPWLDYINQQLPGSLKVGLDEIVIVDYPEYFERLNLLLTWTSKKTLANYIALQVSLLTMMYSNERIRNHVSAFNFALENKTLPSTDWQYCVETTKILKTAIASVYVREHFDRKIKEEVHNMIDHIKTSWSEIFNQSTWMDATTKKHFLEKLAKMKNYIAYPEELFDDEKLDEYYNGLELSAEDLLFENYYKVNKFNTDQLNAKLRERIGGKDWRDIPVLFNDARYFPENIFFVTAYIIQEFTFNKNRPMYINYARLGTIISHEISHAFGPLCLLKDNDDNGIPITNSTKDFYNDRMECVFGQYSNYTVDGIGFRVNPRNTMEENIADIEGTRLAHKAYTEWTKKNGIEKGTLPGIKESPKQLFWLSYANMWCDKFRKESFIDVYSNEMHSPREIRIMGSLAANPEFAKAYNCSLGSPMNPINRCKTL